MHGEKTVRTAQIHDFFSEKNAWSSFRLPSHSVLISRFYLNLLRRSIRAQSVVVLVSSPSLGAGPRRSVFHGGVRAERLFPGVVGVRARFGFFSYSFGFQAWQPLKYNFKLELSFIFVYPDMLPVLRVIQVGQVENYPYLVLWSRGLEFILIRFWAPDVVRYDRQSIQLNLDDCKKESHDSQAISSLWTESPLLLSLKTVQTSYVGNDRRLPII